MTAMTKQNWWQLSSIQIGGAICLPVIMIGHALNQTYGFTSAVVAVLIGNAILLALGLISAKMSYEKNKTTAENAVEYFGEKGVSLFAWTMVVSLVGWFGIQINMMTLSVVDLLSLDVANSYTPMLLNVGLGLLITGVALYGLRGINLLSDISMPLLFLTLGYALFTREERVVATDHHFSFGGISLVIAMAVAVVIDLPTYFRHAKTCKDGYVSMCVVFALVLPFLEILGVYLAAGSSGEGILDVLKRHDGMLWNIWIASFLILAGWTTNNVNLYSGVVCLEFLWKKSSAVVRTVLFGGVGTVLACCDLLTHFETVLDVMGIFITSMGAVVITRYFLAQFKGLHTAPHHQKWHFLAWACGIACGFISMTHGMLTSIPVLDATIASCVATVCLLSPLILQRKNYEEAYTR